MDFSVLEKCELCERRCKVNRLNGELGYCKAPNYMCISSIFPHYGEERFLIPSLTIFFMGCNFNCVYCQNWSISRWFESGRKYEVSELVDVIESFSSVCRNVNFVGGEPTPYLPWIVKVVEEMRKRKITLPVIWNSNFYMTESSMEAVKEITDIFLPDWKYGNNKCASRLSDVENYCEIVERNVYEAFRTGKTVVIRHLVLPNHVECCSKVVIERIASLFGDRVIVNIMDQYRPEYMAWKVKEVARFPSRREIEEVVRFAEKKGLNVYYG